MKKTTGKMCKKDVLKRWKGLKPNQPVHPRMIPYGQKGKTFAEDVIRITGSTEFIDSVLSRLKDLIPYEGDTTRLDLNMSESFDKETKLSLGAYNCYIRVQERGGEAKIANTKYGRVK